jgi:hypothetical protein
MSVIERGLGVMQIDRRLPNVAVLGGNDPLSQLLHQRQLALFVCLLEVERVGVIEEVPDRCSSVVAQALQGLPGAYGDVLAPGVQHHPEG